MDPALLLADPQVVSAGILFVPLTLLIAVVVPGNVVLPFGDLATIAFFVAIAVGIHHGNIFRTLISGTVIMAGTIWISSHMVDLQTRLATDTGLLGNADRVASLDQGGNPVTYVLASLLSGRVGAGVIVVLVLMVLAFGYSFLKYRRGTLFTPPGGRPRGARSRRGPQARREARRRRLRRLTGPVQHPRKAVAMTPPTTVNRLLSVTGVAEMPLVEEPLAPPPPPGR